ncbi:uncharacterized protein [Dermacentor albipictus]
MAGGCPPPVPPEQVAEVRAVRDHLLLSQFCSADAANLRNGASVQQERKQNKSLFKQQRTMQRMLHLNYQDGIWFAECEDKAELLTTIFWKRGGDTIRRSRTMKSPSKKKELSSKKAGWHRKGSACSGEANSTWRSFE